MFVCRKTKSPTYYSMTLFIDGGEFSSFWYCIGAITNLSKNIEYVECVSSGAMVATLLVCMDKIDLVQILKACLKSQSNFDTVSNSIYRMIDELLPFDAHHRANKRLGIILANLKCKTYTVSQWDTREKLIHCVVASTHVPFITNFTLLHPVYKCIDAGFIIDKSKYKTVLSSPNFRKTEQFFYISVKRAIQLFTNGKCENI